MSEPSPRRATIGELRLVAFKSHVGTVLPLAPVTLVQGASGSGKSNLLDGLAALSGLAGGADLAEALAPVRGGLRGCVPHGRQGFRLGCSVETARSGTVSLEVAVRTDGEPRIVAERITGALPGTPARVLLATGEEDRARGRINAIWHSDGRQGDIRAPLAAGSLLAAQLPLRIAGATPGEQRVLTAVEDLLTALREVFPVDPVPALMRGWVPAGDDARLRSTAANLSAVLARIQSECRIRYGKLLRSVRTGSPYPVRELGVLRSDDARVRAALWEGETAVTGAESMSSGLLRYLAFATVLLTGPGVLQMSSADVPQVDRLLTVLAEDLDAGLAEGQVAELLRLAGEVVRHGHARLLATLRDGAAGAAPEALVLHCRRDPQTGYSVLEPSPAPAPAPARVGVPAAAQAGVRAGAQAGAGGRGEWAHD
ncbi:ATP-binding protein [Streptacidiphilus sp. N1-10]|uniref:ATP-binding protein n=1 Tax=Streptacidiphilus jeojiensis TaxID=3229225 RepID=A0ABV6XV64_9ACTN